jgi:elongator complex protein 1
MRNLSLCASSVTHIPGANLSATAVDLDQNILYVASETSNPDGEVEIMIWKVAPTEEVRG